VSDPGPDAADWPVIDLHHAVRAGLDRGAHLLTTGEQLVADRLLRLSGPPARVYARLLGRKPPAFPVDELVVPGVDDVVEAVASLTEAGWVDGLVPWGLRAELLPRRRLVQGCRALGLPRSGRRGQLEARLAGLRGWCATPFVRPRHRGLVLRLQRWAALTAWPRPERAILERMGVTTWPSYQCTRGPALHADRRALRRWERLHASIGAGSLSVPDALQALTDGRGDGPGALSLQATLRRMLREHARQLERDDPLAAVDLYARLASLYGPGHLAFRRARALEAVERPEDALEVLTRARPQLRGRARAQVLRAARRLGRSLGRGVAPDPPMQRPRRRTLTLTRAGSDHRPLWLGSSAADPTEVEHAVVDALAQRGRVAAHVEGRLFRTLYALLFAEAYFLDVPGQLPVPRLSGPLDLGTSAFVERRRPVIEGILHAVRVGDAGARVRTAAARWQGIRLAGRHDLDPELLVQVASSIAPDALASILQALHTERSAGLPDLVVLPGPVVWIDGHPARVSDQLLLVELKGPGDTLSEAQRAWHHRLLGWGLPVELWEVRPS